MDTKNKTYVYATYNKPTSVLKTHIGRKWGQKNISHAMEIKRKLD